MAHTKGYIYIYICIIYPPARVCVTLLEAPNCHIQHLFFVDSHQIMKHVSERRRCWEHDIVECTLYIDTVSRWKIRKQHQKFVRERDRAYILFLEETLDHHEAEYSCCGQISSSETRLLEPLLDAANQLDSSTNLALHTTCYCLLLLCPGFPGFPRFPRNGYMNCASEPLSTRAGG